MPTYGQPSILKQFEARQNIFEKTIANAVSIGSAYTNALKYFEERQSSIFNSLSSSQIDSLFTKVNKQLQDIDFLPVDNLAADLAHSVPLQFTMDSGINSDSAEVSNYFSNREPPATDATQNSELSDNAKKQIISIYYLYLLPLLIGILSCAVYEYYVKPKIDGYLTPNQVKSVVKTQASQFDPSLFEGKRVTLSSLNLKVSPNQKAATLEELDAGKLLHVFPEQGLNKAWLKVEVDMAGERVTGYVLRRYTTPLKR